MVRSAIFIVVFGCWTAVVRPVGRALASEAELGVVGIIF